MKKKRFGSKSGMAHPLLYSVGVHIISVFAFALTASVILIGMRTPIKLVSAAALASLLLGGALGGALTARHSTSYGVRTSAISAFAVSVLMLAAAPIVGGGRIGAKVFMNIACFVLVSVFFAFLSKKKRKKRR